jgi:hypothetical protein
VIGVDYMMYTIYYTATYRNIKADETLIYKFPITDDSGAHCDELAGYYAEWILEELPQSGFILENLERSYNND